MKGLILLLMSCLTFTLSAQQYSYTGIVVDKESKEPLLGATLTYDGGGTVTDISGAFNIVSDEKVEKLVVSYIGYRELTVKGDVLSANPNIELVQASALMDQLTVTASKYAQRLSEATVSIEVLSSDYINSVNAPDASRALEKVPGVQMIDGQANIRGGSGFSYGAGSRVLLLLDDMPAFQLDASFPNWIDLPIEATEQIEVVKGASSAIYGSSALNGIINLRRIKPGIKPRTELSVSSFVFSDPRDPDNFGRKWYDEDNKPGGTTGSAMHSRKIGNTDLLAHGYFYDYNGYEQGTGQNRYRFGSSLTHRFNDRWVANLSTVYNKIKSDDFFIWNDIEAGIYQALPNTLIQGNSKRYNADASLKYYGKNDDIHTMRSRFSSVNNDNINNQGNSSQSIFAEYQYQTSLKNDIRLVGGIATLFGNSDSELVGDTTFSSANHSAYIQAEKQIFEKFSAVAGMRFEYNEQTSPENIGGFSVPGGKVSDREVISRLGLNYELADYTHLRSSIGQGYRFPSITERFIVTTVGGFGIFPNPQLQPEKGWTAEVGVKQGVKFLGIQGFLDGALFLQKYDNMTEFALVIEPSLGFQSQNVGASTIKGGEISFAGEATYGDIQLRLFGGYTYIDPTYDDFNEFIQFTTSSEKNILKYRTNHNFKYDIEANYKGFSLGAAYDFTSHMTSIDTPLELLASPMIGQYRAANNNGHRIINFRTSYTWNTLKLSFLVDNVANIEYSRRPGKIDPPRTFTLRLDYKIGK